jgi:hypothetical protein
MTLEYENDALKFLKLLAYKYASFEYSFPFMRNAKIIDEPFFEMSVSREELIDFGLTLSKAELLFPAICRKQGLTPTDFMREDVTEDDEGEVSMTYDLKRTKDGLALIVPIVISIEQVVDEVEHRNIEIKHRPLTKKFSENSSITLDELGGKFTYNKQSGRLPVKKLQYKILRILLKSKESTVSYEDLSLNLFNREHKKSDNKAIADAFQVLKEKMGILPKTETSNQNCFKNIAGSGYRLELSD